MDVIKLISDLISTMPKAIKESSTSTRGVLSLLVFLMVIASLVLFFNASESAKLIAFRSLITLACILVLRLSSLSPTTSIKQPPCRATTRHIEATTSKRSGVSTVDAISNSRQLERVCFISTEYPHRVEGGLGIHVTNLSAALGKQIEVDVVVPAPNEAGYKPSLPDRVRLFPQTRATATYKQPLSWIGFAQLAFDEIKRMHASRRSPSLIHCHDWATILAGLRCRWELGIPLVFHVHLPNREPFCGSLENLGLIGADLVTVSSRAMREELRSRTDLEIPCLEVIANGVDTTRFSPTNNWPDDGGYILFVGRLVEQKGVEHLLRAFHCILPAYPEVRLCIVGDGEQHRDYLHHLAANLNISVDFRGWLKGDDLVNAYQDARIIVVPSLYEPFGMTALEGMACQRPVVASRVGGLEAIITHGTNGLLAQPGDYLDLSQRLATLLADSELRNRIGIQARVTACEQCYHWDHIATQFIDQYRGVLKASKPISTVPDTALALRDQALALAEEFQRKSERNVSVVSELKELLKWI